MPFLLGKKKVFLSASLLLWAGSMLGTAAAQNETAASFPNHAITIIVPYSAGGPTDAAIRPVAQAMSQILGQPMVIENIGAAGGSIGTVKVAFAPKDGYTLLAQQAGIATLPALYPKIAKDIDKQLTAIGMINRTYNFLVGRKTLPARNIEELKAWMNGPGKPARFAHPGVGTSGHVNSVVTVKALGTEVTFVPYRGGGQAMNDVLAGHVDLVWAATTLSIPQIKAGNLIAYAAGSGKPADLLPDVPNASAVGLKEADNPFWQMLLAPAGTPEPIIMKLNAALREALAKPDVVHAYTETGSSIYPPDEQTPAYANAFLRQEIDRVTKVIQDNNIESGN
ncbi:tripartite tricarboxylate transporter substrate binding protein [Aquabacter sp. CN5-332]|uniref:Bug family tripartite tricarboxylate transporter substrate binding protein n=1 Tax=Aquabacter sp. CN5-332 TaxID=3156608 RepID=UPI0032B4A969